MYKTAAYVNEQKTPQTSEMSVKGFYQGKVNIFCKLNLTAYLQRHFIQIS